MTILLSTIRNKTTIENISDLQALNNALETINKNYKTDWKISICGKSGKKFKISCLADSINYRNLNLFLLGALKLSRLSTLKN